MSAQTFIDGAKGELEKAASDMGSDMPRQAERRLQVAQVYALLAIGEGLMELERAVGSLETAVERSR